MRSSCCCSSAQPIWTSQGSVLSFTWPLVLRIIKTGGNIKAFFGRFIDLNFYSLRYSKVFGLSFCCLAFSDASRRAKLGTNLWNTLQRFKKD